MQQQSCAAVTTSLSPPTAPLACCASDAPCHCCESLFAVFFLLSLSGRGDVKLLQNKDTKLVRVLLRQEKTLKLCMNHKGQATQLGSTAAGCWPPSLSIAFSGSCLVR